MISIYEDLVRDARKAGLLKKLVPVSAEHLPVLETQFGQIPADYVAFLRDVGAGPLGDDRYMLYTGLLTPDEIFGQVSPALSDLLLFGDDFQGFSQAFDPGTWSVVEIDGTDMGVTALAPSFETFIRNRIDQLL
ncbi:hypothetical protein J2T09_005073 [Neorhizobium huautlense]|uniref:SMI1/KNR4 family protein n=1 Tax=Neorhizobium huautlense TaxID=67774 RepID=A0ABT9Q2F2_9HYPH|nr:SMI1/KNR4 family protein [Neorhizobium huautlense]MDP9840289.1 hypothetical protein [Neorhizobium huautlense]